MPILGGQSGSPAIVQFPSDRDPNVLRVGLEPPVLIGLISGHYNIASNVKVSAIFLAGPKFR